MTARSAPSSTLAGVVFDLDGVLVDSEPLHARAMRMALLPLGVEFGDEEFVQELMGKNDAAAFARAFELRGRACTGELLARVRRDKTRALRDLTAAGVEPCPGALELLHAAARVLPVALCTGSCREEVDLLLAGLGPDVARAFRLRITSDDVESSKPDPEGYRRAVEGLGLPPARTLALEDTPTGVTAALGAGLRVLGVDGLGRPERLAAADRVVAGLAGVTLPLLRQWFA